MKFNEFFETLNKEGIQVWEAEGKLKYRAPAGKMLPEYIAFLKANKEELLIYLKKKAEEVVLEPHPEERYEPFPLTEIQMSYLLGREQYFQYGDTACHIYFEMEYQKMDSKRIERVWNQLIREHDMLHSVIHKEGFQEVLKQIPNLSIPVYEETEGSSEVLERIREQLGHVVYDTQVWPFFGIVTVQYPERTVLCYSFDFLLTDWSGIWSLLYEFEMLYEQDALEPEPPKVSFRDYVLFWQKLKKTRKYMAAKEYWMNRIEPFPEAPKLPVRNQESGEKGHFTRYHTLLELSDWKRLQETGREHGITGTVIVLAVYSRILAKWSSNQHFCMNLTLLNRMPVHEDIHRVIGDFTSITLLEMDYRDTRTWLGHMESITQQLFQDMDHQFFSGVEVLRELSARHNGETFMMPFVFTSAIGSNSSQIKGKMGYGISQTPQVFIDCQVMDTSDGLLINWDVRDGIFEPSMIEDMFAAFTDRLQVLAKQPEQWKEQAVLELPDWQLQEREAVNRTAEYAGRFMEEDIFASAKKYPSKPAVIDAEQTLTYEELAGYANTVAIRLKELDIRRGDCVGILMEKSVWQIVAVLGILKAGAVYVPIDGRQGEKRIQSIIRKAGIQILLTKGSAKGANSEEEKTPYLDVEKLCKTQGISDGVDWKMEGNCDQLAYVIFTSGSTGTPKGVAICHRAAMNTIDDITKLYGISSSDTVLGLSQLNFDLSVYDIFGILGQGGTLVFPDNEKYYDPSHWRQLMERYQVTVWNTVPALMQMLTETFGENETGEIPCPSLRVVMLSGDWIPTSLAAKLTASMPALRIACMGGATEASIWSILHEYEDRDQYRESIPYGKPLANQTFRVLDERNEDCPAGVVGELCIGGVGLAKEYYHDTELTEKSFVYDYDFHKGTKERLYKTGDLGRYLPGGEIEFIGRKDTQVKIKGHRIELGEIETTIKNLAYVKNAVVLVNDDNGDRKLIGYAECENPCEQMEKRILEDCAEYLPAYMIPRRVLCFAKLPLTGNGKIDRKALAKEAFWKEETSKETEVQAMDETATKVLAIVEEVLGTKIADPGKNFYYYGADSFLMAQLVGKLREQFGLKQEFGAILLQLMNHPMVLETADYVRKNS